PPDGAPPRRRPPQKARTDEHHDEVGHARRHHGFRYADAIHEEDVEESGQKRAAAESHDGHSRRHASTVWKPLDERAEWRAVAKSTPDASDDPHPEKDNCRLAQGQTNTAENQPGAKEHGRGGFPNAGTATLHPRTSKCRAQAEQDQSRGERRIRRAEPPRAAGKNRLNRPFKGAPAAPRPLTE